MNIVTLIEKRGGNSESIIEIDNADLESFKSFQKYGEYLSIPDIVIGDKKLPEWYQINNLSYWWFADPVVSPKFEQIAIFIDRLEICIKKYNPSIINLKGFFDKIDTIKHMCMLNNIELKIDKVNYSKFLIKEKIINLCKKKYYNIITKKKYNKRKKLFHKFKSGFAIKNNSVFLSSYSLQRKNTVDIKTGNIKKEESFLQPFIEFLQNNNQPYLCIDLDYTLLGDNKILEERLCSESDWYPIDILLDGKKSKSTNKKLLTLKKSIEKMYQYDLNEKFLYKKISIWSYLKTAFDDVFLEPYLPSYIHLIEKLETFLKEHQPKAILQLYETGPFAKAFVVASEKLGIKTIGIQHGNFHKDVSDYMMKQIRNENFPMGNPISSITLVFGEQYKKLLTEVGNYPKNKVEILGNLSLYNLEKIKNILDRKQLLLKNNLPDKKIVLFPLSFRIKHAKNNPDIRILKTLYDELKNNKDIIVFIRPHPGDKNVQEELNKICPGDNFVLSKDNSNFEDIFLSDVIVLYSSTLGMEAGLFEKPVFYTGELEEKSGEAHYEFLQNMIKNDMADFVPLSELANKINQIEKGTLWKISESDNKRKFLEYYLNYGKKTDLSQIFE